MKFINKNILKISLLILVFFILDRVLKYLALADKIFFYKNTGIAFSINMPENLFLYLYIFIFLFLIFIIWHLLKAVKNNSELLITGYWLLITGTTSNLVDRIKFGFVIDYLNFYFFYNNLADIMIIVGISLLIFCLMEKKSTPPPPLC